LEPVAVCFTSSFAILLKSFAFCIKPLRVKFAVICFTFLDVKFAIVNYKLVHCRLLALYVKLAIL
jgi:hypothetical protein